MENVSAEVYFGVSEEEGKILLRIITVEPIEVFGDYEFKKEKKGFTCTTCKEK